VVSLNYYVLLNTIQVILGGVVLYYLIRARELRAYWPMLIMATWQALPFSVLIFLRLYGPGHIPPEHAYNIYFFTFWPIFGVSSLCSIALTYTIFRSAMAPLKGLQSLGQIMYRWAAAISVAIAIAIASTPTYGGQNPIIRALGQLQLASAILILSLVTFVGFAIRPMGLSMRSRVFGASVGTMILAATNMLQAGVLSQPRPFYSNYAVVELCSSCVSLLIWIYYFAIPEPKRKFILLPTTSPFHRWNQISELLGHDPGYVAIGGVPPEAFAAAEIEVFHRASAKMNALSEPPAAPRLPGDHSSDL
jgi:hypothetical protein